MFLPADTSSMDMPTVSTTPPFPAKPRPYIICLCGPRKYAAELTEQARLLGLAGHIVLTPVPLAVPAAETAQPLLEQLQREKIDMADMVHIVNPHGDSDEMTLAGIAYARSTGKPLTFLFPSS